MQRGRFGTKKVIFIVLAAGLSAAAAGGFLHRHGRQRYRPDYEPVPLYEILEKETFSPEDYRVLLYQTGLGETVVSELSKEEVLAAQEEFFSEKKTRCTSVFYGLVWEDRRTEEEMQEEQEGQEVKGSAFAYGLAAAQPGDILISLSAHTLGWRHGHAGLVLSGERVLESTVIGSDSGIYPLHRWNRYADYAVLRVKGVPEAEREQAAFFAEQNLAGVPYRLTAGLTDGKFRDSQEESFGVQCAYLVWYAWMAQGVDLDSDGGSLVTPEDILYSPELEILQVYGMNPELFKP